MFFAPAFYIGFALSQSKTRRRLGMMSFALRVGNAFLPRDCSMFLIWRLSINHFALMFQVPHIMPCLGKMCRPITPFSTTRCLRATRRLLRPLAVNAATRACPICRDWDHHRHAPPFDHLSNECPPKAASFERQYSCTSWFSLCALPEWRLCLGVFFC